MHRNAGLILMVGAAIALVIVVVIYWLSPGDFVFAEVRGRVTYKGQPLPEGTVMFVAQKSGLAAAGTIQPDGTYVLISRSNQDGATVGPHRVAIVAPYQPQTPNYPLFPREYQDPDASGFQVEVVKGKNVFDFDLQDKGKTRR